MDVENEQLNCPGCRKPLGVLHTSKRDFFCRQCGTAVAVIDERTCLYMKPRSGVSVPCSLAELRKHPDEAD